MAVKVADRGGDAGMEPAAVVEVGSTDIMMWLYHTYCLFALNKIILGERFLLSKDEPLTPDIDGVMAL